MPSPTVASDAALGDLSTFAGQCLKLAITPVIKHGFLPAPMGTTMRSGWWNGTRYQTTVLDTDDPSWVETMCMNWLLSDHKKAKFAGVVMDGYITVDGTKSDALILRARTADSSIRLIAYQPYRRPTQEVSLCFLKPFVDFPAEDAVPLAKHDFALAKLLEELYRHVPRNPAGSGGG